MQTFVRKNISLPPEVLKDVKPIQKFLRIKGFSPLVARLISDKRREIESAKAGR